LIDFILNSIQVGSTIISSSAYAATDTGSTFIMGPETDVNALNEVLNGTYSSSTYMV
jgi:hypothetical protein